MRWEEYYDKIEEWATSTAVSRMSQLTSFGPPEEVMDAINTIGCMDEKGAVRLLKKATAAGVKFSGEQLSDLCLLCDREALNCAIQFSSDRFTAEDLEALYCNCDDDILIDIARKQGLKLPEDLADSEESETEPVPAEKMTAKNSRRFCPYCGRCVDANYNFCPDCGKDLRSIPAAIPAARGGTEDYGQYLRVYPNKLEAIRALRVDSGMSLAEAKKIIDKLFGADTMPEKPVFKHDSEWKVVSSTGYSYHKRSIEADAFYYAGRYYPNKAKAIGALLEQGYGEQDTRKAVDDAFLEIKNSLKNDEESERQKKAQNAVKTIGKGVGLTAFFGGYGVFRILSGLVKPFMGKRR